MKPERLIKNNNFFMRYKLYSAAVALLLFSSCDKFSLIKTLNVDLPYSEEFKLPSADTLIEMPPGGLDLALPVQAVATNVDDNLATKNLNTGQVTKVLLKSYTQNVAGGNFDFIDGLRIFISAKGLPEVQLASRNDIPKGADKFDFSCTDANLKEYFMQDSIYIRTEGHINNIPDAATYRSNFEFRVVADVSGK